MKVQTTIAVAAVMLLGGAVTASAANIPSSHSGMAMKASDSLSLNAAQQKTAWNDLSRQSSQTAPAGFTATDGAVVPNAVAIRAVPSKATRDLSQLRPYDFAMVQGKLLIVNPNDRKVAEVITG